MAILTREEIIRQAQDLTGNTSNDMKSKMQRHINVLYERISKVAVPTMLIKQKTFQLTASARQKSLGSDVLDILVIRDTTNNRDIKESTLEREEKAGVDTTNDTGDPFQYDDLGEHFVNLEVGTAGTATLVSSDATDASPNIVRITGLVSSVEVSEDMIVDGTSTVTSTNTWDADQKLIINTGTNNNTIKSLVGYITVSRSDVLSIILPNNTATIYRWISLLSIPDSGASSNVYRLTYLKRPTPFNNDNDIPVYDCSKALITGLIAFGVAEDGDDALAAQVFNPRFESLVVEVMAHFKKKPNLTEQFAPEPLGPGRNSLNSRIGGVYT